MIGARNALPRQTPMVAISLTQLQPAQARIDLDKWAAALWEIRAKSTASMLS